MAYLAKTLASGLGRRIRFLSPVYFRVREILPNLWEVERMAVYNHIRQTLGDGIDLL